jgi:CBS domain-containing protein
MVVVVTASRFTGRINAYRKDIMTKDVVTVTPETSIEELAALLVQNEISGAPVVDEKESLSAS